MPLLRRAIRTWRGVLDLAGPRGPGNRRPRQLHRALRRGRIHARDPGRGA